MTSETKQVKGSTKKWNVVYTARVTGTVSQERVEQQRKIMIEHPKHYYGVFDIEINQNSKDEDIANYLMLEGEVIEKKVLDVEIEESDLID